MDLRSNMLEPDIIILFKCEGVMRPLKPAQNTVPSQVIPKAVKWNPAWYSGVELGGLDQPMIPGCSRAAVPQFKG